MSELKQLEQRIARLKLEENIKLWDEWYKEGKSFLEKLVGKCFITQSHNDQFYMYKVLDVKEQKVWGIRHNYGYFELKTEGHFNIRNAKHIYGAGKDMNYGGSGPYGTFTMIDKKGKTKNVSDIVYHPQSITETCNLDTSRHATYGRYCIDAKGDIDYDKYAISLEKPQQSVPNEFNSMFTKEVPENIYNEFKHYIDEQAKQALFLWEKYEKDINNLKRYEC